MNKFIVKLVAFVILVAGLVLILGHATLLGAISSAIGIAILAYLLGDLFVLPRTNNVVATLVDAVTIFAFVWAISANSFWGLSAFEILVITLLTSVFEYFFHIRLLQDGIRRYSRVRVR